MKTEKQNIISNSEKAFKGFHSQTMVVAIKAIISLIYFSIMSRLLTPADFGYFALITSVTVILNSLSEAGLGSSVIQKKDADKAYISTALLMSFAMGTLFSNLLFFNSSLFSQFLTNSAILTNSFKLMSITVVLFCINSIGQAIFMKELHFLRYGLLQCTASALSYALGIILAMNHFGFMSIVIASISEQVLLTIILIFVKAFNFPIAFNLNYAKDILSYGGWLTVSVIIRNVTNEVDKMIIGKFMPIEDLGAINRPSGLMSRITNQITGIFDTILFPILSTIQGNLKTIQSAFVKSFSLILLLSMLVGSILILSSKYLILIFFGENWMYLQNIFMIFAAATILHGISRICDCFYRSMAILKLYSLMRLINCILVLSLIYIGCQFGILGVAVCMFLASLISNIVKYLVLQHKIKISFLEVGRIIAKNSGFIFFLLLICLSIMILCPYGDYYAVFAFLLIIIIVTLRKPKLLGPIFVTYIANRYLVKLKKYRYDD